MTFGERVKRTRLSLQLSQADLASKTGISERSLYTYEQGGIIPRTQNLKRLADALGVTVSYLLGEDEGAQTRAEDLFLANARNRYGAKGAREAGEILDRASALFAGGELDEEAKEIFFRALTEVYLESKAEASQKFATGSRVRKSGKKQP